MKAYTIYSDRYGIAFTDKRIAEQFARINHEEGYIEEIDVDDPGLVRFLSATINLSFFRLELHLRHDIANNWTDMTANAATHFGGTRNLIKAQGNSRGGFVLGNSFYVWAEDVKDAQEKAAKYFAEE